MFRVSFSAALLCQFSYFISCSSPSVFFIYKCSRNRHVGIEFIQEQLWVATSRRSYRRTLFSQVSVLAGLPPTSYMSTVYLRSLVGLPYRWLNIHPSEQRGRSSFLQTRMVVIIRFNCKVTEISQRLYRSQIFTALDAACTVRYSYPLAFQVALTM